MPKFKFAQLMRVQKVPALLKSKNFRLIMATLLLPSCATLHALKETRFGRIDLSATASAQYDSRVFGISSQSLQAIRSGGGGGGLALNEIESEDDFILQLSPAVHYTHKLRWFTFTGSAGLQMTQFLKNTKKSYFPPTTSFTIDFDESLKKRISNNAKIRFDMTFDLGQSVETSVVEQDLVSYSYFVVGTNVRYNHSPKFGLGGGASYNLRDYQAGSVRTFYNDVTTIPLYARAFYIYSPKLDFYTNYGYTSTKGKGGSSSGLIDGANHSWSFGANGELTPKLSGSAQLGYTRQSYDASQAGQSTLTLGTDLQWALNRKTSFGLAIDRGISPSPQGYSILNTTASLSVNHRFTDDVSGRAHANLGTVDYTADSQPVPSMDTFGFGFSLSKTLSDHFSTSGGYDYTRLDRAGGEAFGRHLLRVDLSGRF